MGSPHHQSEPDHGMQSEKKESNENEGGASVATKSGSKGQGRKRTKSGCLTCRRRRIKCGEERPTCQNCIKSKRQCEGYNQRVVFKDPLNVYRGPSIPVSAHIPFSGPSPTYRQPPQQLPPSGPLPIAPKPQGFYGSSIATQNVALGSAYHPGMSSNDEQIPYGWQQQSSSSSVNHQPLRTPNIQSGSDLIDRSYAPEPRSATSNPENSANKQNASNRGVKLETRQDQPNARVGFDPTTFSSGPSPASQSPQELYQDHTNRSFVSQGFHQPYSSNSEWNTSSHAITYQDSSKYAQIKQERVDLYDRLPKYPEQSKGISSSSSVPQSVIEDEDDPFDVSDDDVDMEDGDDEEERDDVGLASRIRTNDLGVVIAMQAMATPDTRLRSFTTFIDRPDMLATYVPSPQSSPLRDPMTARIFCHFINVTGPCMSMFERHPANPLLIFQGYPVPKSQQHIWTYTFPTMALQNSCLLHAMLALASLHIAKLQNGPITTSLKHYAYSLRRVAKNVGNPNRRGDLATLAASMLLAYYEVWCADHQKWSNHLLGARMLLRETNFESTTNYIKSLKREQRRQEREGKLPGEGHTGYYDHRTHYAQYTEDVDENLVAMLSGRRPQYDPQGRIVDDSHLADGVHKEYTEKDLETYETQRDLFWWYCKQDAYQSMLGGGKLFMEFELWNQCLPRAPIGRLNATYGTFDHLVLLNGRLAAFMNKDLRRKRLAWKAQMARAASTEPKSQRKGSQAGISAQAPQMPPFNGMVPNVGVARPPMGFDRRARNESPVSDVSEEMDLETSRADAEQEWQDIRNAYSILESHFGEDFQALGPEFSAPIDTPFGPALQYRTYGIAGIWMNYYMALICCYRAHPSMPPAAMAAVGIAAQQTAFFANEVGRIAAGMAPDCSRIAEVSPGVGAGLIESGTALFIAGVQYQVAGQRDWVIGRLHDLARLTGWETALAVCVGCETSWVAAAQMGRGPPYERANKEVQIEDIRFETPGRRVDAVLHALPPNERRMRVESTDRVHYALGVMSIDEDLETLDLHE